MLMLLLPWRGREGWKVDKQKEERTEGKKERKGEGGKGGKGREEEKPKYDDRMGRTQFLWLKSNQESPVLR